MGVRTWYLLHSELHAPYWTLSGMTEESEERLTVRIMPPMRVGTYSLECGIVVDVEGGGEQ